jgi:hypothetical protein
MYITGEVFYRGGMMHSDSTLIEPVTFEIPCNLNRNKAFIFCNMEFAARGGVTC